MRRWLLHVWAWLVVCPLPWKDYHHWYGRVGDDMSRCLTCDATRRDEDD